MSQIERSNDVASSRWKMFLILVDTCFFRLENLNVFTIEQSSEMKFCWRCFRSNENDCCSICILKSTFVLWSPIKLHWKRKLIFEKNFLLKIRLLFHRSFSIEVIRQEKTKKYQSSKCFPCRWTDVWHLPKEKILIGNFANGKREKFDQSVYDYFEADLFNWTRWFLRHRLMKRKWEVLGENDLWID